MATDPDFMFIGVPGPRGRRSTISVHWADYREMLQLARGSGPNPEDRVAEACRDAAIRLIKAGYTGKWSPEVRRRALAILRGSYMPARAAAYVARR